MCDLNTSIHSKGMTRRGIAQQQRLDTKNINVDAR
jgi:hypothetical protein